MTAGPSEPPGGLRRDIEGLRGVAVGLVLLYHLGVPGLVGGFAGVDVFFVISGFLITGLLLREIDRSGTVSIRRFYARRARRLLPAASVVLLATAVAGWWLLPGSAHATLGRDVVASTLYLVNWELASRSVDYLAEGQAPSPLQHYWSLSVEEQFYVVWPVLILLGLLLARRAGWRPRRVLLGAIVALGAASFAWSVVLTASDPARAYFVSTTRVWELALGAALAFGVARLPGLSARAVGLLAWAGTVAVLASAFLLGPEVPWPGVAAALPTLGTVALLAAGTTGHDTLPGRVLGWRPLVALGGISYATYLWHWPIVVIAEVRLGGIGLVSGVAIAAASLGLAWLTGRLVENPVRFHPRLAAAPLRSLVLGAVAMAVTVSAGVLVEASVPSLSDLRDREVAGAAALVSDPAAARWEVLEDPRRAYTRAGPLVPPPALAPADASLKRRCQTGLGDPVPQLDCAFGAVRGDVRVAMLGDSKMAQWFPALTVIARREGWRLEPSLKSACTFSLTGVVDDCAEHTEAILEDFERDGPPDRALISQRLSPEGYDADEGGLEEAVQRLVDLGVEVVVVADNPAPPPGESVYDCVELHPGEYDDCDFDRAEAIAGSGTPLLLETAEALGLSVVDLDEWICPSSVDTCPPAIGGALVYRQGSHVTDTYVRTLTPMLHRGLAEVGWTRYPAGDIPLRGG